MTKEHANPVKKTSFTKCAGRKRKIKYLGYEFTIMLGPAGWIYRLIPDSNEYPLLFIYETKEEAVINAKAFIRKKMNNKIEKQIDRIVYACTDLGIKAPELKEDIQTITKMLGQLGWDLQYTTKQQEGAHEGENAGN
jgi:hypothetical protein